MGYENKSNEELEQLVMNRDMDAIRELAERCRMGVKGCEKNLTRAANLYHKGEKKDCAWAYKALGDMYANGEYFAQNNEVANEYYAKAGLPAVSEKDSVSNRSNAYNRQNVNAVETTQLLDLITMSEQNRENGNYSEARRCAEQALQMINNVRNGATLQGAGDIDVMEINSYWQLAYIAFNEQRFSEMERNMNMPNVLALHPWGAYLLCVMHQMNGASDSVKREDLNRMLDISENINMSDKEKADVYGMIGDLYIEGYGPAEANVYAVGKKFYEEAAKLGSMYASDRLNSL